MIFKKTRIQSLPFPVRDSRFLLYPMPQKRFVFSFAHFVSTSSETPMYCASVLAT